MYDGVFLSSFGSNVFSTLGVMNTLKSQFSDTVIWNCVGNSSLIIFFKILGLTLEQTYSRLEDFPLIHSFVNCFSIIPENQTNKKRYIREWLVDSILETKIFEEGVKLSEVFKMTNIFPSFLVWSKTNSKPVSINPVSNPNVTLVDAVLASLCGVGTYHEHHLEEEVYGCLTGIDTFPLESQFLLENKNNVLKIVNLSYFVDQLDENFETPMTMIEDELLQQFLGRNNHTVKQKKDDTTIVVHSDLHRSDLSTGEKKSLYKCGFLQGQNFMNDGSTYGAYRREKSMIRNQD